MAAAAAAAAAEAARTCSGFSDAWALSVYDVANPAGTTIDELGHITCSRDTQARLSLIVLWTVVRSSCKGARKILAPLSM